MKTWHFLVLFLLIFVYSVIRWTNWKFLQPLEKKLPISTCQYHYLVFGLLSLKIVVLSLKNHGNLENHNCKNRELKVDQMLLIVLLCMSEGASQCTSFKLRNLRVLFWLLKRCFIYVALKRFLLAVFEHWSRVSLCLLNLCQNHIIFICLHLFLRVNSQILSDLLRLLKVLLIRKWIIQS